MSDSDFKPSVMRRLWVVLLLTCLLITMPVALVILLTGPVYKRTPEGYTPIGKSAHRAYASFLILWVVLATLRYCFSRAVSNKNGLIAPTPAYPRLRRICL